ncbi:MAG: HigA family addiction module antitoxin [Beijerinckiaceae bacterium]
MLMKNPPHPGRGLREDLEALGLSVADAARGLGVTRQQLYKVMNGQSAISSEMAIRLEKGIGTSAETWLRMQAAYDLAGARRNEAAMGVTRLEKKAA